MDTYAGERYEEMAGRPLKEIAARIREDIAELQAAGTVPASLSVSVTTRHGSSIDISVSGFSDATLWRDGPRGREFSAEAQAIKDALDAVHRAYNRSRDYPGRDYADHDYYGGVTLLDEREQRFRAEQQERSAAMAEAAKKVAAGVADAPYRVTKERGRPPEVVVRDRDGEVVALVEVMRGYTAEMLTMSYMEYLLDEAGWEVVGYARKSKKRPKPYWGVRRKDDAPALEPVNEHVRERLRDREQSTDRTHAEAPRPARAQEQAREPATETVEAARKPSTAVEELGPMHGPAAPLVTMESGLRTSMPPGDVARRWLELEDELKEAGYLHRRAPEVGTGWADHLTGEVVTDDGETTDREVEHLAFLVAEVRRVLAPPVTGEAQIRIAVARLKDDHLTAGIGSFARKRSMPTGPEALVCRALVAELERRHPEVFDAVDQVDPGSDQWLKTLWRAAAPEEVRARKARRRNSRAVCEGDPRAEAIVLDGTGLSGTMCCRKVWRRKPLVRGGGPLLVSNVYELCGEVARWAVADQSDRNAPRVAFCTKHGAEHLLALPALVAEPEREPVVEPEPVDLDAVQDDLATDTDVAPAAAEEPLTDGEGAPVAEEDPWDGLEIMHTPEEGTILIGTHKGDGAYDALCAAGQRWRGMRYGEYAGCLYVRNTRDKPAKRFMIDAAKRALEKAGFAVRVRIDDHARDAAEVRADKHERLEERRDRLGERAGAAQARADGAHRRANEIGERFAGGQPIIVGHYSEPRARRDQARMHSAMDTSVRESARAGHLGERVAASEAAEARKERPLQVARRIYRDEKDLQKLKERQERFAGRDVSELVIEQVESEIDHLEARLKADRELLREHVEAGRWRIIDQSMVKPGDWVKARGDWDEVLKANPTTVKTASAHVGWLIHKWHEVGDHRTKAEVEEIRRRKAEEAGG